MSTLSHKELRAYAILAAAAHEFNEELTIIFSVVCDTISALPPAHPAREQLLEARGSAQRCAWKASGMLNYTARAGVQPFRTSLDYLIT